MAGEAETTRSHPGEVGAALNTSRMITDSSSVSKAQGYPRANSVAEGKMFH